MILYNHIGFLSTDVNKFCQWLLHQQATEEEENEPKDYGRADIRGEAHGHHLQWRTVDQVLHQFQPPLARVDVDNVGRAQGARSKLCVDGGCMCHSVLRIRLNLLISLLADYYYDGIV